MSDNLKVKVLMLKGEKGDKGDTGSVENLKIGVVNLLSDTKDFKKYSEWVNHGSWTRKNSYYNGFRVLSNKGAWNGISKKIHVKKGEAYTFSLYARRALDSDFNCILYIVMSSTDSASVNENEKLINLTNEFQRYFITFTVVYDGYISPRVEIDKNITGAVEICGYKLERYETPTDWTPAIEDYENEINNIIARLEALEAK